MHVVAALSGHFGYNIRNVYNREWRGSNTSWGHGATVSVGSDQLKIEPKVYPFKLTAIEQKQEAKLITVQNTIKKKKQFNEYLFFLPPTFVNE